MYHRLALAAILALAGTVATTRAAEPGQAGPKDPPAPYQPGTIMAPEPGVVALVEGHSIYLPEIADALRELPENMQRQTFERLYPPLLEDAINHSALLVEAQEQNLDADPDVRRRMKRAENRALENELLGRVVAKQVTEQAIHARYDQRYAGVPGIEARRVRIMIIKTRDEAAQVQAVLAHGADFATLAKQHSVDPSSINGGEVGFVQQTQLPPELVAAVFGLAVGAVSPAPIPSRGAWDIVKVEESRLGPVPSLDDVRGAIKNELVQETIRQEIQRARAAVHIQAYNMNGTPYTPPTQDSFDDPLIFDVQGPK